MFQQSQQPNHQSIKSSTKSVQTPPDLQQCKTNMHISTFQFHTQLGARISDSITRIKTPLSSGVCLPSVWRPAAACGSLRHERGADTPRRLCKQIAPVSRTRLSSPKRKSLFPPFLRKTDRENRNFQGPAQPPWKRLWGTTLWNQSIDLRWRQICGHLVLETALPKVVATICNATNERNLIYCFL